MPRTRKPKPTDVPAAVLDDFAGTPGRCRRPTSMPSCGGSRRPSSRMLGGELMHHLRYRPGGTKPPAATNQRNGTGSKTVVTDEGALDLEVPRDRDGTFEPQLIPKHARRFAGFDDRSLALYARA